MTPPIPALPNAEKTLELLWTRVRQRGNLPGFSKVVSAVLGAMRGDDDRDFNMTKTVLSDPALTQRVLRLANSPMYSVFGGDINTVSKAVLVLGTESIGHLALGLKLIDGLASAAGGSGGARGEMEKAVFAGHIARQVTASASTRDIEQAVVCSMLHSLGRMMSAFYLPEYWAQIEAHSTATGESESVASNKVFGLGMDELGRRIAQHWGLPPELVNTFHDIAPEEVGEPLDHINWLAAVSTMSSSCARVLCNDDPAADSEISKIAGSYAEMLGLNVEQVMAAVETAKSTANDEAVFRSPGKALGTVSLSVALAPAAAPRPGKPDNAVELLGRGVADMKGAANAATTVQIISMALETVFKGLGFSRSVAFFRSSSESKYLARLCFGEGMQDMLPKLAFADAYQPDVFHAALANDKMIFVENAKNPAFTSKLPRWWKDALPTTRGFMILPLTVNRKAVGFIYGDWDESLPLFKIGATEVPALDEIRAIVVQSIFEREKKELSWMV